MPSSRILKNAQDVAVWQLSDMPVAPRTIKENKMYEKKKRLSKNLDREAWNRAVKLVRGKWSPFREQHRLCFKPISSYSKYGNMGSPARLMYEFKRAVLLQNWSFALKLADTMFKNYYAFSRRSHIKTMLALLLSHPKVNTHLASDLCSFLYRLEDENDKTELIRCFCSLPKEFPYEKYRNYRDYVFSSNFGSPIPQIKRYTSHIGKSDENNDVYVE